ncbi:MAG TPA: tetratricopeptide repeat protein [Limnobacter sp.]|nr:tetratricopeptide repeat protein [Limnobacter sp.]
MLAGCASTPVNPEGSLTDGQNLPELNQKAYQARVAQLVKEDPLFALLTAELASQRGDTYSATLAYSEAAKQQKSPELARRAVELALNEGQADLGLQAALVWAELAPTDPQASRTVMLLQLSTNRVDDALPALRAYIATLQKSEDAHPGIAAATPERVALEMLMRIPDKAKAYQTGIALFGNNADDPEAQNLLAQIAHASEQHAQAVEHMQNVIKRLPQERFYVQLAQFMEKRDNAPAQAMAMMAQLAAEHPKWFGARLYLARNHTQLEQWEQARERFTEMIALQPDNYPLYSSLGFVFSKLGNYSEAVRHFEVYLQRMPAAERQNESLIHATLSDMALDKKDYAGALRWLDSAPYASSDLEIQIKKSALFQKQGNLMAASRVLNQFKAGNEDDAVRLTLAKSQLAEAREQPTQAITELEQGLATYPDQPDLLYERAMVAERQNDLVNVEQYLRRLISVSPDNPHGYNALGYTFADNNMRLDEAHALIRKAVELAPNDPFILDSLGWVQYRLGQFAEAEQSLKKAFGMRQDEEIGVHLMEVLIQLGKNDEARQLGQQLRVQYPESSELKRLQNKLEGI